MEYLRIRQAIASLWRSILSSNVSDIVEYPDINPDYTLQPIIRIIQAPSNLIY